MSSSWRRSFPDCAAWRSASLRTHVRIDITGVVKVRRSSTQVVAYRTTATWVPSAPQNVRSPAARSRFNVRRQQDADSRARACVWQELSPELDALASTSHALELVHLADRHVSADDSADDHGASTRDLDEALHLHVDVVHGIRLWGRVPRILAAFPAPRLVDARVHIDGYASTKGVPERSARKEFPSKRGRVRRRAQAGYLNSIEEPGGTSAT